AAACFEHAIDALRHLPRSSQLVEQIIDLCFDIRQSCVPLGDHARALAYLRIAEEEAEAIGDRTRLGWAYTYRAHGLYIAGDSRGVGLGARSRARGARARAPRAAGAAARVAAPRAGAGRPERRRGRWGGAGPAGGGVAARGGGPASAV